MKVADKCLLVISFIHIGGHFVVFRIYVALVGSLLYQLYLRKSCGELDKLYLYKTCCKCQSIKGNKKSCVAYCS